MKMLPFKQRRISPERVIRTFSQETPSEEFKWHRDAEDREITPLTETDWMLQIDNELPKRISGTMKIPAGVYHRVIKGSGNLNLEVAMIPRMEQ